VVEGRFFVSSPLVFRRNGGPLAEQAGERRPDGMQRLLSTAVWDENGVRDEVRSYVLAHLEDPYAVVAIDETSFRQQGQPVSRRGPSIVWQHQTRRELSGRGISLLHQQPWSHAARPGAVSAAPLAGRPRSLRKSRDS
jgi:DDE superfamily endonuclease